MVADKGSSCAAADNARTAGPRPLHHAPGSLHLLSPGHPCLLPLWRTLMFLRTEPADVISLTVSPSCLRPVRQDCRTEVFPPEAETRSCALFHRLEHWEGTRHSPWAGTGYYVTVRSTERK